jgi:hypothetical protein
VELDFAFSWPTTKSKLPCNFEELIYVARIFLPHVIYENVDIVFIGIYNKHGPGSVGNQSIGNLTGYRTNDQYCYPLAETMNCSKNKNV